MWWELLVDRFVVASVGFDERFIVRLLISARLGVGSEDFLLLVMPEDDSERCLAVVEAVKKLVHTYGLRLNLETLRVNVDSFWESAGSVRKSVEKLYEERGSPELIVLLSGGMRALILEVLSGCVATGLRGNVIVYREDLKGHVEFPLDLLKIDKPMLQHIRVLEVIRSLGGRANLKGIMDKLYLSKASAHRRVRELEEIGLVRVERRGRASKILLTEKAKLWV